MKASYAVTNRENYRTWKMINKGGPYWYIKDVVFDDPVPGSRIEGIEEKFSETIINPKDENALTKK